MTIINKEQIQCPECGNLQNINILQSINVTLDPKLKNDLVDGKINWFDCEACEFESHIPVPFMYHDMELEYVIQYVPIEHALEEAFLANYNADGTFTIPETFPKGVRPNYISNQHIVFNMNELICYVLFRDKLAKYYKRNA